MNDEAEYHSKDFEWNELKQEIESDSSLSYHFFPYHTRIAKPSPALDSQAWNNFHHRHSSGKFYKERRYLLKEFPELAFCDDGYSKVLEVGCGNGSTALPILRGNQSTIVYACDCSNEALERAKSAIDSSNVISSATHRFQPFCCDFSTAPFPKWLVCDPCRISFSPDNIDNTRESNAIISLKENNCCIGGVDVISLIFTLSAVPVNRMRAAIKECFSVLKPGGLLLFRDYGLYDMTMLRFEESQRVGFREYMRSDGTRSYFFCLDTTKDLFLGAGFVEVELEYCCINSVNRRKGKTMRRVWIHAKFCKPMSVPL